jgi:hypothetical protein
MYGREQRSQAANPLKATIASVAALASLPPLTFASSPLPARVGPQPIAPPSTFSALPLQRNIHCHNRHMGLVSLAKKLESVMKHQSSHAHKRALKEQVALALTLAWENFSIQRFVAILTGSYFQRKKPHSMRNVRVIMKMHHNSMKTEKKNCMRTTPVEAGASHLPAVCPRSHPMHAAHSMGSSRVSLRLAADKIMV